MFLPMGASVATSAIVCHALPDKPGSRRDTSHLTSSLIFGAAFATCCANVAYSGGTVFNFVNNTPDPGIRNFQT